MRAVWLLIPLALCAACLRQIEYRCDRFEQCDMAPGGSCEPNGYCSYFDPSCPFGQRFGELAGPLSNQCVDDGVKPPGDGGLDGPPIDGPAAGCPAEYQPLPGGPAGHLYRKTPQNVSWINQDNFCRTTSSRAYLAVPDDAAELTNLHALAGGTFWAGIHDTITEGTFVKLPANTAATFLPWAAGQPNNLGGEDCVAADSTTFNDASCQDSLPAACECEP